MQLCHVVHDAVFSLLPHALNCGYIDMIVDTFAVDRLFSSIILYFVSFSNSDQNHLLALLQEQLDRLKVEAGKTGEQLQQAIAKLDAVEEGSQLEQAVCL